MPVTEKAPRGWRTSHAPTQQTPMTDTNPSQDQPGGPSTPVMIPGRAVGAGDRADRIDDTASELWDALTRARADYSPMMLAAAEDSVFRFYLPMAFGWVSGSARITDVEHAAEVGLAEAMLRWPRGDSCGFEAYARAVIAAQLRRLPSPGARLHRGVRVPSARPNHGTVGDPTKSGSAAGRGV